MKPVLPLLAGAAVIAAAMSFWSPVARAQQPVAKEDAKSALGQPCVITLNPEGRDILTPVNEPLRKTGLRPEGTVEGTLLEINDQWVILKDGSYENWIPTDKVLLIRVSR